MVTASETVAALLPYLLSGRGPTAGRGPATVDQSPNAVRRRPSRLQDLSTSVRPPAFSLSFPPSDQLPPKICFRCRRQLVNSKADGYVRFFNRFSLGFRVFGVFLRQCTWWGNCKAILAVCSAIARVTAIFFFFINRYKWSSWIFINAFLVLCVLLHLSAFLHKQQHCSLEWMRNVLTQSLIRGRNSDQFGPENIILSISPFDPIYSNSWPGSCRTKSIAAAAPAFEDVLLQLWFVITPQKHCSGLKTQLGSSSNESTPHQALRSRVFYGVDKLHTIRTYVPACMLDSSSLECFGMIICKATTIQPVCQLGLR